MPNPLLVHLNEGFLLDNSMTSSAARVRDSTSCLLGSAVAHHSCSNHTINCKVEAACDALFCTVRVKIMPKPDGIAANGLIPLGAIDRAMEITGREC